MKQIARSILVALTILAILVPIQAAATDSRIDINKASVDELVKLPRIGPAVAERIVEYRKANGPFRKVEELMGVRGIGQRTFEKLKDLVSVTAPAAQSETRSDSK